MTIRSKNTKKEPPHMVYLSCPRQTRTPGGIPYVYYTTTNLI